MEDKPKGCYRCGGDHLMRDCTIEKRYQAGQQPRQTAQPQNETNQQDRDKNQNPAPKQGTNEHKDTNQENTNRSNTNKPNGPKNNQETEQRGQRHQEQQRPNQNISPKPTSKSEPGNKKQVIYKTPERGTRTEDKEPESHSLTESPPPTPTMHPDTPSRQTQKAGHQQTSQTSPNSSYRENSWLHPKNTQRVTSSFVSRTESGLPYTSTKNKFQALDPTTNIEDSYFEDQIKPISTPTRNKASSQNPPNNRNNNLSGGFLNSTPFQTYVTTGTSKNTRKNHKRKEQDSPETTGKKLDSKQTPETKQPDTSTEIRLLDTETRRLKRECRRTCPKDGRTTTKKLPKPTEADKYLR